MLDIDYCINQVLAVVDKYKHHQSIVSTNKKMRENEQPNLVFLLSL